LTALFVYILNDSADPDNISHLVSTQQKTQAHLMWNYFGYRTWILYCLFSEQVNPRCDPLL